eukprot:6399560-Amphidinium_carterae.1
MSDCMSCLPLQGSHWKFGTKQVWCLNTCAGGRVHSCKEYFMINVWEGGNIEIEFKGTFVDSDTNIPVKMNNIYVTWHH